MRRTIAIDPKTAAYLAERRRMAGVTQNALALELNVSEGMVSKLETARTPITPAMRRALDEALSRLSRERVEAAS